MNAMKRLILILLVGWSAVVAGPMDAGGLDGAALWDRYREAESSFRQANELLRADPARARALLEKAALSFEAIHRDAGIENGRLFYNLGNIYVRLGDTGRAILNYRRAERFIPNDINLQQNLAYARSRALDKIEPRPEAQVLRTLFFWHYDLGGPTRAWLFAGCFGLLWCFASLCLLLGKPWLRRVAVSLAGLSLLLAGSLVVEAHEQSTQRFGVILEQEIVGRKGDSTTFEPTFKEPLHAGAEFRLVEERKGWLHIELADGRRCWIPEASAGLI